MIFDTHAHYDDESFAGDRNETLLDLPSHGIGRVLIPSVSVEGSRGVLALAAAYDFTVAAVGIHPHEAAEDASRLPALESLLSQSDSPGPVALGECGLDYHYDFSPRDVQKIVFDAQLSLAERFSLPVIVHVRESMADCLDIIRAHPEVRCIFHCFSGTADEAKRLSSAGHMISFAGSVTFKKAQDIRDAAAVVPNHALLMETDAPYLAPAPMRGKRCDSRLLCHTAAVLAEVRKTDTTTVERLTWDNGHRFLGL